MIVPESVDQENITDIIPSIGQRYIRVEGEATLKLTGQQKTGFEVVLDRDLPWRR